MEDNLVCIVITRNGEGTALRFGSKAEARLHPIPQMDDVYAENADELVSQYGKGHIASLARFLPEGRDRGYVLEAMEGWKGATRPSTTLPMDAVNKLWDSVMARAQPPSVNHSEIVRIVTEDRAFREGKLLRSLSPAEARSPQPYVNKTEREFDMSEAKRSRVPDNSTITILAEKNPKREGTPSFDRFALYQDGMTVKAAKEAGVKAADITYDEAKGFISLTAGAPEPEKTEAE